MHNRKGSRVNIMKRLLVTGAAGFIGSNFVHYWRRTNADDVIVVLDALTYAGNKANLAELENDPQYIFVQGSIGDHDLIARLLREHNIDTLVHFAAESHVDRSITGPDAFIDTNIVGTHTLLKAAKQYWLDEISLENHLFHHVSTDEVYGTLAADDPAFSESTQYAPNSPYAASKAASDHLVRSYHHTFGLKVVTSNCSNNYGPYQFPEKLIPLCLLNILNGKALPIYGDGKQIRDWRIRISLCQTCIVFKAFINNLAEQINNIDIRPLIISANVVGLSMTSVLNDKFNAPTVVIDE